MFSEKLNFLMEITNVQNNKLATAVKLDASHISRLRHGTRRLPKNQNYLMPMVLYFSRQIKLGYQKKIIGDSIGIKGEWPDDNEMVAKLLYNWLLDNISANDAAIDSIIQSFSMKEQKKNENTYVEIKQNTDNKSYYYGIEGKREAVIRFLTEVANEDTPQTLLLFSDEEMSWLYEDRMYAKKWAVLLKNVLMRGNRIKIIHTVSRDLNELLEAVAKWIPIYATGVIEPYYYPKLRDGLFRRTLFIAPKTAAITSTSVHQKTDEMLNVYIEDDAAVSALVKDFQNYLSLCRPLMHIYNVLNADSFKKLYLEFMEAEGDCISFRNDLSIPTMPQSLINELENDSLSALYSRVSKSFLDTLKNFSFTEILSLPKEDEAVIHSAMLGIGDIKLTNKQHTAHVKNIISLLKTNANYDVVLSDMTVPNIIILAKENFGVIMISTQAPCCTFAFTEQNMVGAFWDHFANIREKSLNKNKTIKTLEKSIALRSL